MQPIPPDIAGRLQKLGFPPTWEGYQQWLSKDGAKTGATGPTNMVIKPGNGPGDSGNTQMDVPPLTSPTSGSTGGPQIFSPAVTGGSGGGGGGGGDTSLKPFQMGGGGGSSSSSSGGSSMTPYIQSITSNGGGNNNAMIQSLLQMLSQSGAAANKAGLAQYQNLLNSVKTSKKQSMGMYGQALGQLNNFGASEKADIEQTRLNDRAGANQDLINRGLGNTTVLNTELGGADTRAEKSKIALGGTIAGMKSGLLQQKAGLNFQYGQLGADSILSKQNMQPDMGMYLQLLQSLGSSGSTSKGTPIATR